MADDNKGFDPQYDDNKIEKTILFGKAINKSNGSFYRKAELLIEQETTLLSAKNKDGESTPVTCKVKDEVTLYESDGGQEKIQCWLIETNEGKYPEAVHISRRKGKGIYGSQEITLLPQTALAFRDFLNNITVIDTSNKNPLKYPLRSVNTISSSHKRIISNDEFKNLISDNIKSIDDFYSLLLIQKKKLAIERLREIIDGKYENEVDIQKFLKENIWLFGNEYTLIARDEKINAENILDIIPKNIENYVDIIEVKLPNEELFNFDNNHKNYYPTSHLTKAISQTQNYIFEFENKTQDIKYQEENQCTIICPKATILFGSSKVLSDNEKKYLRILNSSYHNIHIITYQQLLEKAENMLNFPNISNL